MNTSRETSAGFSFASTPVLLAVSTGLALICARCGGSSDSGGSAPPKKIIIVDGCPIGDTDPKESPLCVNDALGLFVSPNGDDANDGTKVHPMRTIAHALSKLAGKSHLFLCQTQYNENIQLTSSISIFGGLSCTDWSYLGLSTTIAGSAPITITGADDVVLSDVDFFADPASSHGGSSVAGFFANSTVSLRRTVFRAGAGKDGSNQAVHAASFPDAPRVAGNRGVNNADCQGTQGGDGAYGCRASSQGMPVPAPPGIPSGNMGQGGDSSACDQSGTGHVGSDGLGGAGGLGSPHWGLLAATGWQPQSGTGGQPGQVGQGGGGGGGPPGSLNCCTNCGFALSAAFGAPGGCGGIAGQGGEGGGSSVALAIFNSHVNGQSSQFFGAEAGKGGDGGGGGKGQAGAPGSSYATPPCNGGAGGSGGGGGGGGGGAGGLSVGILWTGNPPILDGNLVGTTTSYAGIYIAKKGGDAGNLGAAGTVDTKGAIAGTQGSAGISGLARAVMGLNADGTEAQ